MISDFDFYQKNKIIFYANSDYFYFLFFRRTTCTKFFFVLLCFSIISYYLFYLLTNWLGKTVSFLFAIGYSNCMWRDNFTVLFVICLYLNQWRLKCGRIHGWKMHPDIPSSLWRYPVLTFTDQTKELACLAQERKSSWLFLRWI